MEVKLGKRKVEIPDTPQERRKELDRVAALYNEGDNELSERHAVLSTQVAIDEDTRSTPSMKSEGGDSVDERKETPAEPTPDEPAPEGNGDEEEKG